MAQTNLDVVTGSRLEQALSENWDAMKTWVLSNIDNSNLMTQVKSKLDTANRQIIGTTGTAKADALVTAVDAMVQAFEAAGISMSGITTAQFASCINSLAEINGVYILDSEGLQWTAENWSYQKQQLGHDPATPEGITISNPHHDLLIASVNIGQTMFGTYSHTIPSLQAYGGSVVGTPEDGTYNSRKIMAATNPINCESGRKLTYFEGMKYIDTVDKDVIFFPSESTLTSWANTVGLSTMVSIGTSMIYAVPQGTEGYWILKYFSGTTSIAFANREAKAPYTDIYGMIGCTALEYCYSHKEHDDDDWYWRLPSLYELMIIYLNKTAVDACRSALGTSSLPNAEVWSCLQNNNTLEYCLSLASGACNNGGKANKYWCVPVASCRKAVSAVARTY